MLKKNMGPMGPRGLGPWALWAPGALGPLLTPKLLLRPRLLRRPRLLLRPPPFASPPACPPGFFFGKNSVPKQNNAYLLTK